MDPAARALGSGGLTDRNLKAGEGCACALRGGIIAVFALLIRKELLLPILCGVYLAESLSVIIQRGYFKYTKKMAKNKMR